MRRWSARPRTCRQHGGTRRDQAAPVTPYSLDTAKRATGADAGGPVGSPNLQVCTSVDVPERPDVDYGSRGCRCESCRAHPRFRRSQLRIITVTIPTTACGGPDTVGTMTTTRDSGSLRHRGGDQCEARVTLGPDPDSGRSAVHSVTVRGDLAAESRQRELLAVQVEPIRASHGLALKTVGDLLGVGLQAEHDWKPSTWQNYRVASARLSRDPLAPGTQPAQPTGDDRRRRQLALGPGPPLDEERTGASTSRAEWRGSSVSPCAQIRFARRGDLEGYISRDLKPRRWQQQTGAVLLSGVIATTSVRMSGAAATTFRTIDGRRASGPAAECPRLVYREPRLPRRPASPRLPSERALWPPDSCACSSSLKPAPTAPSRVCTVDATTTACATMACRGSNWARRAARRDRCAGSIADGQSPGKPLAA